MTPALAMKRCKANGASLVSGFHRASPEMAWLCLCQITNVSTETKNCFLKFKQRVALAVELSIGTFKPNDDLGMAKDFFLQGLSHYNATFGFHQKRLCYK